MLFVIYFLEVGLVLIVAPWSAFWDRNFFISALPSLAPVFGNNFVRGAVSGLGVINLCAGIADLAGVVLSRPGRLPDVLGRRVWPAGRITGLGANRTSETEH